MLLTQGRLSEFNPRLMKAKLVDPDNEAISVELDLSLLTTTTQFIEGMFVSFIGEAVPHQSGWVLKPRVITQIDAELDYDLFRFTINQRRRTLEHQGFLL